MTGSSCLTLLFRFLLIYLFLSFTYVLWNNYWSSFNISRTTFFKSNDVFNFNEIANRLIDEEISCKVPKLNPWDQTIAQFVAHPRDLVCKVIQENITYMDMDGYLRFTDYARLLQIETSLNFSCKYRTFDRSLGINDNAIAYGKENNLTEPVKLQEDSVEVVCKINDVQIYHNIHAHPADREDRIFAKPNENQLTVVMFYIDSVSYSVLQRNLPATYNYTKNVMNMFYLESFNKVADNSFPNMMAALMGKRVNDEQEGMMREMEGEYNKIKFDSWPLIWKMFAAKGYATVFNEDMPEWGLFHYLARGFAKKPVDFYYHMFWLALHWAEGKNHSEYCFANEAKPRILLDITKRHLVAMQGKLQFIYSFQTEISHDRMNEVERFDEDLVEFWKQMLQGGYLNKTVVIFASDHGHRFSRIRSTLTGLLEERLPFYGIWFPEWFYEVHPNIKENLKYNTNLLSSTFDIYETLRDILDANYDGSQRSLKNRGLSQLYPLPKNRTCTDAGIPDHYCTCIQETPLNTDHELAIKGGKYLVESLNLILANVTSMCQKIRLKRIMFFRLIDYDEKVKQGIKNYEAARKLEEHARNQAEEGMSRASTDDGKSFRIGIETEPFGAQFEVVMRANIRPDEHSRLNVTWQIEGTVSRLNSYKGLSDCITDLQLRKYCSCKPSKFIELMSTNNTTLV